MNCCLALWCLFLVLPSCGNFYSSCAAQTSPQSQFLGFPPRVTFEDVIGSKTIKESLLTVPYEEGALIIFAGNDPSLKLLLSEALAQHLNATYLPSTASSLTYNMLPVCSSEHRTVLYVEDAPDADSMGVCRRFPSAPLIILSTTSTSCKTFRHFCVEVNAPNDLERRRILEHVLAEEPRASELTAENIAEIAGRTSNFTVDELHTLIRLTVRATTGHLAARHFVPAARPPKVRDREVVPEAFFAIYDTMPWFLQFPPTVWGVLVCGLLGHFMAKCTYSSRRPGLRDPFEMEFGSMPEMGGMGSLGGMSGIDTLGAMGGETGKSSAMNFFDPADGILPGFSPDFFKEAKASPGAGLRSRVAPKQGTSTMTTCMTGNESLDG